MTVRHRSENTISADDDLDLLQILLEKFPQPRNNPRHLVVFHPLDQQHSQMLLQTLLETPISRRDAPLPPIVLRTLDNQRSQVLGHALAPTKLDSVLYY